MLKSYTEFYRDCLKPFEQAVKESKYVKLPYEKWKTICEYNPTDLVSIIFKEDKVSIFINNVPLLFDKFDGSFGEFLTDKFFNKEENKSMIKFDFGPCSGNDVRMSAYGIAVKNASGTFVSYDTANGALIDVDIFNFDGNKFLYKMPVAIKDIAAGDIVVHARKPMFVTEVFAANKSLKVVDPVSGEMKEILLTRSPFGFDFATKIVNFLGNFVGEAGATAENPFGNMWMFMLMENSGYDSNSLLPLLFMNQNGGEMNPLMMYAFMGNNNSDNLLPLLMMSNMNKPHTCHCGGHCNGAKENN